MTRNCDFCDCSLSAQLTKKLEFYILSNGLAEFSQVCIKERLLAVLEICNFFLKKGPRIIRKATSVINDLKYVPSHDNINEVYCYLADKAMCVSGIHTFMYVLLPRCFQVESDSENEGNHDY